MKKYPACFPENFEKDILPKGAKHEDKDVYRIIKYGKLDRDSFIGTYEEIQRHLIPPKKKMNLEDPGLYSTSCNIEYSEAEYVLNMMMRHYPEPFIAKGCTQKDCGPCQLTSEREERKGTHVDWWVYEETEPQKYFSEVKKADPQKCVSEVTENE